MIQTEDVLGVWAMRVDGICRRSPRWILGSFWAPPLILLLPIMAGYFSSKVMLGAGVAASAFVCYSLLAYLYWSSRNPKTDLSTKLWTILIVLGYDGLGLHLISIAFLAFAISSIQNSHEAPQLAILGVLSVYLAEFAVVVLRGGHILKYITSHLNRPFPPEMRWLLGAPAGLAAFGAAFAAMTRGTLEGWVVIGSLGALGACLSAPFVALTFYQIPLFLFWRGRNLLPL